MSMGQGARSGPMSVPRMQNICLVCVPCLHDWRCPLIEPTIPHADEAVHPLRCRVLFWPEWSGEASTVDVRGGFQPGLNSYGTARFLYAPTARSWCAFRPSVASLEPENGSLSFRRAQRHSHHRSCTNRSGVPSCPAGGFDTVARGGRVLFVGTKRQAQDAVADAARRSASIMSIRAGLAAR